MTRPDRHCSRPALAALAALCTLAACTREAATTPPVDGTSQPLAADTLLLTLDGIEFRWGDAAAPIAFYDSVYPQWSLRTKLRKVLEDHLVPLRLAQRAFPELRAEQLQKARAMQSVCGNALELARKAEGMHHRRGEVGLQVVEVPVAMFLLDRAKLGSVSDPVELPQGYMLCGALDLREGGVVGDDLVDAVQVPFQTHDHPTFRKWLDEQQAALATKASFVHPEYRNAMPVWLKLP
ncbi:MAG: hypothetical protein RL148_93 [Planctomycetota bacterium]|jgi:hypothetical protein